MTIHIDYDREENKIELILASQGNVIRTLSILHEKTDSKVEFMTLQSLLLN